MVCEVRRQGLPEAEAWHCPNLLGYRCTKRSAVYTNSNKRNTQSSEGLQGRKPKLWDSTAFEYPDPDNISSIHPQNSETVHTLGQYRTVQNFGIPDPYRIGTVQHLEPCRRGHYFASQSFCGQSAVLSRCCVGGGANMLHCLNLESSHVHQNARTQSLKYAFGARLENARTHSHNVGTRGAGCGGGGGGGGCGGGGATSVLAHS